MTIVSPSMTRVTFARTQRAKPEPPDSLHGVDGPGGCGGGGLEDWVWGFGRFLNTTAARTTRTATSETRIAVVRAFMPSGSFLVHDGHLDGKSRASLPRPAPSHHERIRPSSSIQIPSGSLTNANSYLSSWKGGTSGCAPLDTSSRNARGTLATRNAKSSRSSPLR